MFKRHEVLRAFAAHHGQMLNYAAIGRTLATTRLETGRYLRHLHADGWLRLLPSLPAPCPPDIIRRPRLYMRRRAWKEVFAPDPHPQGCLRVPIQSQLASRITDAIIERETSSQKGSLFYSMGRYRARGIDLVVQRAGGFRLGFCFEPWPHSRQAQTACNALHQAMEAGWINSAIMVCCEGSPAKGRYGLLYLSAPLLLAFYSHWSSPWLDRWQVSDLLQWLNEQQQMLLGGFRAPEDSMSLDSWGQWLAVEEPAEPPDPFQPRPP